jgi:hypothetical protein
MADRESTLHHGSAGGCGAGWMLLCCFVDHHVLKLGPFGSRAWFGLLDQEATAAHCTPFPPAKALELANISLIA